MFIENKWGNLIATKDVIAIEAVGSEVKAVFGDGRTTARLSAYKTPDEANKAMERLKDVIGERWEYPVILAKWIQW